MSPRDQGANRRGEGAERYIAEMDSVPGWFSEVDARLIQVLLVAQTERGVTGDLLEIGVYQGRTAGFLGFLFGPREELHVCDPFQATTSLEPGPQTSRYVDGSQELFERRYASVHGRLPVVHACRSDELASRLSPAAFRFVHVDGSHAFADVARDLELVRTLLVPGGIVCIDDYRQPHTPGVALATWAAVAAGQLTPVCMTESKLYAVLAGDGARLSMVADVRAEPRFVLEEHRLLAEGPVLRLWLRSVPWRGGRSCPVRSVRRGFRAVRARVRT